MERTANRILAALAVGGAVFLSGCGIQIPADPGGTLEEVRGGTLRVGVSSEPGLAELTDTGATGDLVTLVEGFAAELDAQVDWQEGSEEHLVSLLERDALDLAVGGFTSDTPWVDLVGTTRDVGSFTGVEDRPIVFLIQPGENAFLTKLEGYIDEEAAS